MSAPNARHPHAPPPVTGDADAPTAAPTAAPSAHENAGPTAAPTADRAADSNAHANPGPTADSNAAPSTRQAHRRRLAAAVAVTAGVAAGGLGFAAAASADAPFGTAVLRDPAGAAVGRVQFFAEHAHTRVVVRLDASAGVTPAQFHGLHVHTGTDTASGASGCVADPAAASTTWFVSAGGHLKQAGQNHSGHDGDLQSLLVTADGRASTTFVTDRFSPAQLDGRAVVLHAGADNFGNVPVGTAPEQYTANSPAATTRTQNTGNAGDRVACGVVRIGGRRGH